MSNYVFLLVCVALVSCSPPTDLIIQGKIGDRCMNRLVNSADRGCALSARKSTDPSVTLLVPSVAYDNFDGAVTYPMVAGPQGAASPSYFLQLTSTSNALTLNNLRFTLSDEEVDAAGIFETKCARTIGGAVTPIPPAVVVPPAVQPAINVFQIPLPEAWVTRALEFEASPRLLCVAEAAAPLEFFWTGFLFDVVWNCAADSSTDNSQKCKSWVEDFKAKRVAPSLDTVKPSLTARELATLDGRKKCCLKNSAKIFRAAGVTGVDEGIVIPVGKCINEKIVSCCGSVSFNKFKERCCTEASEVTQLLDEPCPCRTNGSAAGLGCPVGESCCLPTKFPELIPQFLATPPGGVDAVRSGECYNPNQFQCCDTGKRYDPGTRQCCPLTGVQFYVKNGVDNPCPCSATTDCRSGTVCCKQTAPLPPTTIKCDIYMNYKGLSSQISDCSGRCIDTQFQLCCNGVTCKKEYEKCCNATCCNKFSGTCMEGFVEGHVLRKNIDIEINNWSEYRVKYDTCSEIEQLDTVKSFWIFVLPTVLLIASFTALALVLVFANKSSSRSFSLIERSLIVVAVLALFVALPLFFSPVYKYGVVVVLVALFTIVTAAAPVKALNVANIIVLVVALIYLFDPFFGNAFLTLASDRQLTGLEEQASSGILHATNRLWRESRYCTAWYNYFNFDLAVQDAERVDNFLVRNTNGAPQLLGTDKVPQPLQAFGYCSRSWITALEFFEGFILIFTLLLFILSLVAVILRFKIDNSYEPIELEVQQGPVYFQ